MPPETKSAAGGSWLDEEMEIPTLKADEPKADEPKADEPKADEPKADEPKADEPKADEPKADEPKADKKVSTQIPKKRFDQVNNRLKEAEKKLREIGEAQQRHKQAEEAGDAPRDADWFDEREDSYMAAVVDGDATTAKKIRQEIRAAERSQYQSYADDKAQRVAKEVPAAQEVNVVIGNLRDKFPALDQSSDVYDAEIVGEVLMLQRGYMNKDNLVTPAQALAKAAARLGMDLDAESAPKLEVVPAPVAEKPASLTDAAAALDTAEAQPAEMGSRSGYDNGEDSIDWNTFSEEDLEKLPVSKQREMRGDTFRG